MTTSGSSPRPTVRIPDAPPSHCLFRKPGIAADLTEIPILENPSPHSGRGEVGQALNARDKMEWAGAFEAMGVRSLIDMRFLSVLCA